LNDPGGTFRNVFHADKAFGHGDLIDSLRDDLEHEIDKFENVDEKIWSKKFC
jgi:hypothetical protein